MTGWNWTASDPFPGHRTGVTPYVVTWLETQLENVKNRSPRTLGSNVTLPGHPSIDLDEKVKFVPPADVRTGGSEERGFEQLTLDWMPVVLTVRVALKYMCSGN